MRETMNGMKMRKHSMSDEIIDVFSVNESGMTFYGHTTTIDHLTDLGLSEEVLDRLEAGDTVNVMLVEDKEAT